MKEILHTIIATSLLLTLNHISSSASAQGTAFTYQGQLQNNGTPASGTYNLQFSLYTNATAGASVAGPVTTNSIAITNGLFTVAIDFGSTVWNGETNWLQIGVETNGATAFSSLSPRQELAPVPYAIFAESANASALTGTLNLSSPEITSGGSTILYSPNDGSGNFFAGQSAGNPANDTGLNNMASGINALSSNTSGSDNTADGHNALLFNTSGYENTANGYAALYNNTNGYENTASGVYALYHNTSGSFNTANGYVALSDNLSGSNNVAIGVSALDGNSSGSGNTAIGVNALIQVGTGTNNIALGYEAGYNLLDNESFNIDIGNMGFVEDANTIRIGTPGVQTLAYVAGTINGDGGGLTNLNASQLVSGVISASVLPGFQGDDSTINGGQVNAIDPTSDHSVIGGGFGGAISSNDSYSTIAGGYENSILDISNNAEFATIGGGENNTNSSNAGTVAGGQNNFAAGQYQSTVGGGYNNLASGSYGTVPGGFQNIAAGVSSFAAGSRAQATNNGAFVWSDNSQAPTASFTNNQFMARASGGVVFLTGTAASPKNYATGSAGVAVLPGQTSWSTVSDRNAKKNFRLVDEQVILDKLASVPIEQWNYKWESDGDVPNIGPMAQDFKHAFYPGRDDKSISTLEFDGVELAAIEGLNQKLEAQSTENAELKQENKLLAKRLDELEAEVKALARNSH